MPPPNPPDHPAFQLHLLEHPFFVKQLESNAAIPPKFLEFLTRNSKGFISVTRTDDEISIVGQVITGDSDGDVETEPGNWRCIKIAGPMDFGITGVMCNFTAPLKAAEVPVFAVSTWNTDYILIPRDKVSEAVDALAKDGWTFVH